MRIFLGKQIRSAFAGILLGAYYATSPIAFGTNNLNEPPFLNDYLVFPKFKTELIFQDHNRSCAVGVRFTQSRVTTKALEILQAHLSGHSITSFGNEPGPVIQGNVAQDGVEFKTPCPQYMYIYQLKTDGLMFSSLAEFALGEQYDGGHLGITRGHCTGERST